MRVATLSEKMLIRFTNYTLKFLIQLIINISEIRSIYKSEFLFKHLKVLKIFRTILYYINKFLSLQFINYAISHASKHHIILNSSNKIILSKLLVLWYHRSLYIVIIKYLQRPLLHVIQVYIIFIVIFLLLLIIISQLNKIILRIILFLQIRY